MNAAVTWMGHGLTAAPTTLGKVRAIDSSDTHACAVREDGRACWGEAAHGELGDGTRHELSAPAAVLEDAVEIAVSDDLSCARKRNGELWCWGTPGHCDRDSRCDRVTKPVLWTPPEPSLGIAARHTRQHQAGMQQGGRATGRASGPTGCVCRTSARPSRR